MTRVLRSLRRFVRSYAEVEAVDPTRPGAARVRDGVPIAHDGPPGFPGRAALPGDADPPLDGDAADQAGVATKR